MVDKYDKNGYNSSDFKRNSTQELNKSDQQDGEEGAKLSDKAGEYMRELLSEKIKLSISKFPVSIKLIDQEVTKVQTTGRLPSTDTKYLDVFREKPAKVTVKVLVPVKEHPKFNFVGKLLGPKGNTMKHLQEETMCKMAVLGRGSMRDRQKEEELRNSLEPKYSHLSDELHVEISAVAPPAEAHARIAYALAEVKKYLIPDSSEVMWPNPMRNIERDVRRPMLDATKRGYDPYPPPPPPHAYREATRSEPAAARSRAPPRLPPGVARAIPAKSKVISILDRARNAMDSYGFDDHYGVPPEPPIRGPPRTEPEYYYERSQDRYYDDEYYKEEREYKRDARRPAAPQRHYARAEPYARPPK